MENWETYLHKLLKSMGFEESKVEIDSEHNHGSIVIYDQIPATNKENLPAFIEVFNHVMQLVGKQKKFPPMFFDINNYRRQREQLISELARTAARKVAATKKELSLPFMNSYERRIVHVELAAHPTIKTESVGKGKERCVMIKPVE